MSRGGDWVSLRGDRSRETEAGSKALLSAERAAWGARPQSRVCALSPKINSTKAIPSNMNFATLCRNNFDDESSAGKSVASAVSRISAVVVIIDRHQLRVPETL